MRLILPALAACTLMAAPASAQLVGGGLVVVNVSNVANNIARDLSIDVENVPVTVQVPVSVAALVCGVDVNVLARQDASGNRGCTVEQGVDTSVLNKFVQKQMRANQ